MERNNKYSECETLFVVFLMCLFLNCDKYGKLLCLAKDTVTMGVSFPTDRTQIIHYHYHKCLCLRCSWRSCVRCYIRFEVTVSVSAPFDTGKTLVLSRFSCFCQYFLHGNICVGFYTWTWSLTYASIFSLKFQMNLCF